MFLRAVSLTCVVLISILSSSVSLVAAGPSDVDPSEPSGGYEAAAPIDAWLAVHDPDSLPNRTMRLLDRRVTREMSLEEAGRVVFGRTSFRTQAAERPAMSPISAADRRKLSPGLLHLAALAGGLPGSPSARGEQLENLDSPSATLRGLDLAPAWQADGPQAPPRTVGGWLRVIVTTTDAAAASAAGMVVQSRVGDIVSGVVRLRDLPALVAEEAVVRVSEPATMVPMNDMAREDANVPIVEEDLGLSGRNVAVAVIDSGLDFTHPSFRNPDGSTRVRGLFDLAYPGDVDADGKLDGPVSGGTTWSQEEIDEALQYGNGAVVRSELPVGIGASDIYGDLLAVDCGCPGASVELQVHISHPWLPDLRIGLTDPDGRTYSLDPLTDAVLGELQATYRVPFPQGASTDGIWTLLVLNAGEEEGLIRHWSLHFDQLVFEDDLNGHGTHVAGSAAGNGQTWSGADGLVGVAPEADILAVRATRNLRFFANDDTITALTWVETTAAALGVPYVVNMSLGGHGGSHDGTREDEKVVDELFRAGRQGRAIAIAAGNEGNDAMHGGDIVDRAGTRIPLELASGPDDDGLPELQLDAFLGVSDVPAIGLEHPAADVLQCVTFVLDDEGEPTDPLDDCDEITRLDAGAGVGFALLDDEGDSANFGFIILQEFESALALQVRWYMDKYYLIEGPWSITLRGAEGRWDAWQPGCMPLTECDNAMTIGMPGTSRSAITVGAHTTRPVWLDINGGPHESGETMDDLASFSSRGPTRDARPKPDLTAPGSTIISALASTVRPCPYADLFFCAMPEAYLEEVVAPDLYASSGTSMASPMVAGAAALLLEYDPGLDSATIKDVLREGARLDAFTGADPDPNDWGAGKLDLAGTFGLIDDSGGPWDSVAIAGLRFYAETDVTFLRQPVGVGTYDDPIVLYEAITGPDPTIRIEGILTIDNRAEFAPIGSEDANLSTFWLKKVVLNGTGESCEWFDHELQSELGVPSPQTDGLSFAQGDADLRPWSSNRFRRVIEETEARDFVNFSSGELPPGESGYFRYVISQQWRSAGPRSVQQEHRVWLLQQCNRIPATPAPLPTRTPRPRVPGRVFLPLAISDPDCPPKDLFNDVAVVIDASTTMLERLPDGRQKYELAVDAARAFVYGMRLTGTERSDQVTLISFNATSTTVAELTPHRSELLSALDSFTPIRELSRIELGVFTGVINLIGPRHRPANRQVMVVISDGQANPVPGEEAIKAADGAKAAGILMYILGVGPTLDEAVLRSMATDEERYFFVPSAYDLERVMSSLASSRIPCSPEVYWPNR